MTKNEKILLSFLLVGPPIGFLAFLLSIAFLEPLWTCIQTKWCLHFSSYDFPHPPNGGRDFFFFFTAGLALSYLVGGIPALLVGLVSSFWYSRNGRLPLLVSISTGLVCALVVVIYDFNTLYQNYNHNEIFNHLPYRGPISAITENEWRNFVCSSLSLFFTCAVASWAGRKLALSRAWLENKA